MYNVKHSFCAILLSATSMLAAACGDDSPKAADASVDTQEIDAPEGCVCDPVGPLPMQSALANADVKPDVEVLTRAPRHPGCAGPEGLP